MAKQPSIFSGSGRIVESVQLYEYIIRSITRTLQGSHVLRDRLRDSVDYLVPTESRRLYVEGSFKFLPIARLIGAVFENNLVETIERLVLFARQPTHRPARERSLDQSLQRAELAVEVKPRHQRRIKQRGRVSQLFSPRILGAPRHPASGKEVGVSPHPLWVFVLEVTGAATVLKITARRREARLLEESQSETYDC